MVKVGAVTARLLMALRGRAPQLFLLFAAATSLAACGGGMPVPKGGGAGIGGIGGASDPPLLAGPCDWRGVGQAKDLRFSPDGRLLVAASGGFLKVFDAATGAHRHPSGWQPNALAAVIFSP